METYKCFDCASTFTEADRDWDVAVNTGRCPRCHKILRDFPQKTALSGMPSSSGQDTVQGAHSAFSAQAFSFCPHCGTKIAQTSKYCSTCGTKAASILAAATTNAQRPDQAQDFKLGYAYPFAGFWYRTLALIIDNVITTVAVAIIVFPLAFALGASMAVASSATEIKAAGQGLGFIVGFLIQWLYFTISESSAWQATLGKKLLGIIVTDEAGKRIGFGRANGRYWSKILSALILCIGYIMVAFTEKKQGLHDKIAGTLVFIKN